MYDTPYWDQKWGSTAGYTVFRDSFSAGDLLNARVRYHRFLNDALEWRIKQVVTSPINRRLLWAGIAADREAFWTGDYKDWIPAGQSLYENALLNLLVAKRAPNEYLPLDRLKEAKVEATKVLREFGYGPQEFGLNKLRIPPRMEKEVSYELTSRPNPRDVFGDI